MRTEAEVKIREVLELATLLACNIEEGAREGPWALEARKDKEIFCWSLQKKCSSANTLMLRLRTSRNVRT